MELTPEGYRQIAANYRRKAMQEPARRDEFLAAAQDGENLAKLAEHRAKNSAPTSTPGPRKG